MARRPALRITLSYSTATRFLLAGALALSVAMLVLSWDLPLLEYRSFRQTQTALSSYWMATTSNWLAYPTPMFGYPWSIPFEFPLYQGIVLGVANVLPISLDQSGRLVSWIFAFLTLFPLWQCVREITGRVALSNTMSLFFLLSPLYLFGARCFLIESTALFFSMSFMAALARYWRAPSPALFALMLVAGCLAGLVKITTFFGFGVVGFLFVAWKFFSEQDGRTISRLVSRYLPVAMAVIVALLLTAMYVHYSDLRKQETVVGAALTSSSMSAWNYGTWEQKTSSHLWLDVVLGRAPRELLGSSLVLPLALLVIAFFGRGLRAFAACLGVGYAVPFLVFANLHEVHGYYQQANGVFLLGLVACAVEAVRVRFKEVAALTVTVVLAIVMILGFRRDFLPYIVFPHINQRTVALADFAKQNTRPDDVLLIFNDDVSPEVIYYATRRAMILNDKTSAETMRRMRETPASYTGPYALGMVIVCQHKIAERPQLAAEYRLLLDSVSSGRERLTIAGCDVYK